MNYEKVFQDAVDKVKGEGRYRVFAHLERQAGNFPHATRHHPDGTTSDVVVWCSNDYLGQGQNQDVLAALSEAGARMGVGSGGTRNIAGTTYRMPNWKRSWPICTARKRPCCSPPATCPTTRRSRPSRS